MGGHRWPATNHRYGGAPPDTAMLTALRHRAAGSAGSAAVCHYVFAARPSLLHRTNWAASVEAIQERTGTKVDSLEEGGLYALRSRLLH